MGKRSLSSARKKFEFLTNLRREGLSNSILKRAKIGFNSLNKIKQKLTLLTKTKCHKLQVKPSIFGT